MSKASFATVASADQLAAEPMSKKQRTTSSAAQGSKAYADMSRTELEQIGMKKYGIPKRDSSGKARSNEAWVKELTERDAAKQHNPVLALFKKK